MSSKVDDRIVNMKFNNAQFEKGVADTSKSLETLKKGLNLKDVGKGIGDLASSVKNLSLEGLSAGVQSITDKFSALSVIGITALANIANKAVDAGLTLARSLTLDPIKAGFDEYELKMGSIQTILANTSRYGTDLKTVTANLDELNTYADKTIYNFGDMTKNIGLFTNAGIRIEDATSMIKGFSNEAAASGTSAQGAAGAAYQLSQALSAGTIRLMDWRSLTNVGMGNKNMQNGLIEIADAMGTLESSQISAIDVQSDFNGSLEKNWLSADVMSTYLKIMAGDMDAAEQAALGLSDAQIAAFQTQAQTAEDAATKVRTWTQLVGTMQEGVGSGWAQTFDILIGDFDQATELFTSVNDALGPIIESMSTARNDLLSAWAAGGGRETVIGAVSNAWQAAVKIITPIKEAFQEIFPPMTAEKLLDITKAVENFTKKLIPSEATMEKIKSTAKGFFAVLDIGWMVIQQVIDLFGRLAGSVAPAGDGILGMTANFGDWLVSVRDAIKNGEGLGKIFDWLGDQGEKVVDMVKNAAKWLGDTFPVVSWGEAWENVGNAIQSVWEWLQPFFQWVSEAFQNVKTAVSEAFKAMDFNVLVGLLNVGVLGGIFVVIKKFIDGIPGLFSGMGGGILDTIKGVFGSLTDTMEAMQQKLKADTLIRIAIAIGILTAAVVALSFIDTGKLFTSLGAMSIMFTQLMLAMVIMEKATASKGFLKMPVLAATMIGLATAMVIFSAAVAIMSSLSWDELVRGLTGMAGGLLLMLGSVAVIDKMKGSLAGAGGGLILFGTGLTILAAALKIFSTMSWDDIGRSMVVLAGGLGSLAVASKLIQGSVLGAAAMILVASAVTVLSGAMKVFSTMSWDDIGRSLVVLAGSLAVMVGAMMLMQGSIVGAAAMVVVSGAIVILAGAFKIFATMSWDEIGRALVALAGGLAILAGAMALMGIPIVLLGSVGILAASAALTMLAPALALLGTMSWDAIGRGLAMLGASLAILAVGGLLMIPASVGFLLLGAAMLAIGTGAFLAGTGMVMFSAGFLALAGSAALGAEAIKIALTTIIELIPTMMAAFAQGIIDFALVIAGGAVEFTAAATTLIQAIIAGINTNAPAMIDTLWNLLMQMATKLEENVPILVEKGGNLIIGVLNGMSSKIPGIAKAGTDLMIQLMRAIAREVPRLANEGALAIIQLVNGISNAIDRNAAAMGAAGGRLAVSIVKGMVNGITAGVGEIVNAAKRMAESALNAAKDFLNINSPSRVFRDQVGISIPEGTVVGIQKGTVLVEKASAAMGKTAVDATRKALAKLKDTVATDVNMTPTIRPVLDLSLIKRDASSIGGMFKTPSLNLDGSVAYATQAQMATRSTSSSESDQPSDKPSGPTSVVFNQYNTSPKPLTVSEVYRKTNNQISMAKKELTTIDT